MAAENTSSRHGKIWVMQITIECCKCNYIFEHPLKNHYKDVFDCPKCDARLASHLRYWSKRKIALMVFLEVASLLPLPFLGQIKDWLKVQMGDSIFIPLMIFAYLILFSFVMWNVYRKYIRPIKTVMLDKTEDTG